MLIINKEYRLKQIDNKNVALQRLGKTKEGEDRWTNISYYGDWDYAIADQFGQPYLLKTDTKNFLENFDAHVEMMRKIIEKHHRGLYVKKLNN